MGHRSPIPLRLYASAACYDSPLARWAAIPVGGRPRAPSEALTLRCILARVARAGGPLWAELLRSMLVDVHARWVSAVLVRQEYLKVRQHFIDHHRQYLNDDFIFST